MSKVIKDSGDRTEFSTGAVRDMHGGKGRMNELNRVRFAEASHLYGEQTIEHT